MMAKSVWILLIAFLTGCAGSSYHYYSGDQLPEAALATIKPWKAPFGQSLDVFPISIDGRTTETYRLSLPRYYVLPGEHTIVVAMQGFLDGSLFRLNDPEPMTFQAIAGHIFVTKAEMSKLPSKQGSGETRILTRFWIEDEETGAVVAESRADSGIKKSREQSEPKLSAAVPGTAANAELQNDITRRLFEEASKYHKGCDHRVVKAEAYDLTDPSIIVNGMGEEGSILAKRLRAKDQVVVEKWFVKSCEPVSVYEVLLLRAETGTDILVLKLSAGE